MSWYHYLFGWIVTNLWLTFVVGILLAGLWLQGWSAGRHLSDRSRSDPWGTLHGMAWLGMLRSAKGEDRLAKVHPDTDLAFERPNGEIIRLRADLTIDGQSIPPLARPLIGGPFDGRGRDGSYLHDGECAEPQSRSYQDAHAIQYQVNRSLGLWFRGPIVYAVQLNWGRRW